MFPLTTRGRGEEGPSVDINGYRVTRMDIVMTAISMVAETVVALWAWRRWFWL